MQHHIKVCNKYLKIWLGDSKKKKKYKEGGLTGVYAVK